MGRRTSQRSPRFNSAPTSSTCRSSHHYREQAERGHHERKARFMKAALKTADGRFEVTEVDRPELPSSDWVLARVRVAGICGTDLRHWEKPEPRLEHHITGHELAGEVVEVGAAVTNVAPGDRVVIESVMG